ncbi:MAG: ATP-dependent dethiobiotin synthetase BioD 1 [Cellvibrionales bacterium UBA7375]|nr:dethiobiotin synthase [Gammaproteobacteria bacterium]CAI8169468.1 MAG: ATP-dependent dethiobiotin synthetase BioD 1 [Cellvibrionales bacterium UBA7375]
MAKKVFFITGTDTDVGKTEVAAGLLEAANQKGLRTGAIKPVAAGCENRGDGPQNDDAIKLQALANVALSYQQVNPVALDLPMAPHIAAQEQGKVLSANRLTGFCRGVSMLPMDFLVIEGAGGWRVPINKRETMADIPKQLNAEVILVVGIRLGCINHALLTAQAIRQDGLKIAGWVANILDTEMLRIDENIDTLKHMLIEPCLGVVPRLSEVTPQQVAAHLTIPE